MVLNDTQAVGKWLEDYYFLLGKWVTFQSFSGVVENTGGVGFVLDELYKIHIVSAAVLYFEH